MSCLDQFIYKVESKKPFAGLVFLSVLLIYYFGPRNHFELYLTVNWPHQYWYSFKNVNIATLNWRYVFCAKVNRKHSLIRGVFLYIVAVPELKISPIMYFVIHRSVVLCKLHSTYLMKFLALMEQHILYEPLWSNCEGLFLDFALSVNSQTTEGSTLIYIMMQLN